MNKITPPNKLTRHLKVLNKCGLHARPAVQFVTCARQFRSEITIVRGEQNFSANSIMEILMANLDFGSEFEVHATGPDAEAALDKLEHLLASIPVDE